MKLPRSVHIILSYNFWYLYHDKIPPRWIQNFRPKNRCGVCLLRTDILHLKPSKGHDRTRRVQIFHVTIYAQTI